MAYISTRRALKKLGSNLKRGEEIVSNEEPTEAIVRWQRDTEALMREVLSENSELFKEFHKFASFRTLTAIKQGVYLLRESIRDIEEYGLITPRTQRHPLWDKLWIPLSLVVVGAVVTLLIPDARRWLGIGPDGNQQLTKEQREMQCKQMRLEFDNLFWEFDESTASSLDSIQGEFNSRGVLQSGEYQSYLARFRESKRRRRTYVIDSFYLAYASQGGDTTKLNYRR